MRHYGGEPPNGRPPEDDDDDAARVVELVYLNALLTLDEAAKEASCGLTSLQRARRYGHLHAIPFGSRGWRLVRRDLLAWRASGMPTQRRKEPTR